MYENLKAFILMIMAHSVCLCPSGQLESTLEEKEKPKSSLRAWNSGSAVLVRLKAKIGGKGAQDAWSLFPLLSVSLSKFQVYKQVLCAPDRALKGNVNVTVIISRFAGEGTE